MKKIHLAIVALLAVSGSPLKAGSVTLENFNLTISNVSGTISAMWGTYSSGTFTPLLSSTQSSANTGYFAAPDTELVVTLNQTDNTGVAVSTPLFVSIFNVPGGNSDSVWSSTVAQIVLSDPTWVAPTFTFSDPSDTWALTANTVANPLSQFGGSSGTFNWNSGSPTVSLVPEPSTYALLALSGLAFGGYVVRRRRRA